MSALSLGYYPGCSQQGSAVEYDLSTRAVCAGLGIELKEIEDWSCCGSTPAHVTDHALAAALAGRNLGLAKDQGLSDLATPCPSCLLALRSAASRCGREGFRQRVEKLIGRRFPDGVRSRSILQVIIEEITPEAVAEKVVKPLKGLKLAAYYGCLLTRPSGLMAFEDPENPQALEKLIKASGASVVEFPLKTECCGAALGVPHNEAVADLAGRILLSAEAAGAEALVVACPLCQMNLDLRRGQIEDAYSRRIGMPVIYFTQMLGLALGLGEKELGLAMLNVSPAGLIANAACGAKREAG